VVQAAWWAYISLHGFPYGMVKSCRRYWTQEIADSIVQLEHIRFDNPMFSLTTNFSRVDFTKLLIEQFKVTPEAVEGFFVKARSMDFQDDQKLTTRELLDEFFPGREDVIRLLMEPITYANGSTLEDPAISYGIVFSNFMSKGVYTFEGGTDRLIQMMEAELVKNGVDIRIRCDVEKIHCDGGRVQAVEVNGRKIKTRAVVSNANLKQTIFRLVGEEYFDRQFVEDAQAVRLNNSSTQVYMALKPDERIDESTGDLLFSSTAPVFQTDLLLSRDITSRTFSFYYPRTRPEGQQRCLVVSRHQCQFRRLGESFERRVRSEQAGPRRDDPRCTGKICTEHSRAGRSCRGFDARYFQALYAACCRGQFWDEIRGFAGEF